MKRPVVSVTGLRGVTPGVRFLIMLKQGGRVDSRFAQFAKNNPI